MRCALPDFRYKYIKFGPTMSNYYYRLLRQKAATV